MSALETGANPRAPSRVAVSGGIWAVPGARSWFIGVVGLVFGATAMFSRYLYSDTFYYLYAGRYIVHHGIPHANVITTTARGAPWIDQQWLAHVIYYAAWALGGYPALAVGSAILVTASFAVFALLLLRRGVPPSRMFIWTVVALIVCAGSTWIRTQNFAFLFFTLTLWLLLEDDRSIRLRARTWMLLPVLVLWANTHGSVLLGALLVVLYCGYRSGRALARSDWKAAAGYVPLGAGAALAVVCTPYGLGVIHYYQRLIGNPVIQQDVADWMRPSLGNPVCWPMFALLICTLAVLGTCWRRGVWPGVTVSGVALFLAALALMAVRDKVWFAFGGSLFAADTLARISAKDPPTFGRAFRWVVAGLPGVLAVAGLIMLAVPTAAQFERGGPVRATDFAARMMASNPRLRLLADDLSASAMLWLHPQAFGRMEFDARLEQFTNPELSAYLDFMAVRGPGWQRAMRGADIAVASRLEHPALARRLAALPGWRVIYRDQYGIVIERQGLSFRPG